MSTEDIKAFKEALHKGIVEFKYTKKDGSERTAKGTLNIEVMGESNAPSGNSNYHASDSSIRYYDLNSEGWRSFIVENLIEWWCKDVYSSINLESKLLQVKAWKVDENGKPWKTTTQKWKDILPGDCIMFKYNFILKYYFSNRQPKMEVTVYRNNSVFFKIEETFCNLCNMLKHFELTEIDDKFIG